VLRTQTGSQFQLDELGKRDDASAVALHRGVARFWKCNCLRLSITWELPSGNEFDVDACLSITQFLARTLKSGPVSASHQALMNATETLRSGQHINVIGEAHVAVCDKRHSPNDRVVDAFFFQPFRYARERFRNRFAATFCFFERPIKRRVTNDPRHAIILRR